VTLPRQNKAKKLSQLSQTHMFYKLWWYKKQLEGFELEDIKDINKKKEEEGTL